MEWSISVNFFLRKNTFRGKKFLISNETRQHTHFNSFWGQGVISWGRFHLFIFLPSGVGGIFGVGWDMGISFMLLK
jgi:hypothetical protein